MSRVFNSPMGCCGERQLIFFLHSRKRTHEQRNRQHTISHILLTIWWHTWHKSMSHTSCSPSGDTHGTKACLRNGSQRERLHHHDATTSSLWNRLQFHIHTTQARCWMSKVSRQFTQELLRWTQSMSLSLPLLGQGGKCYHPFIFLNVSKMEVSQFTSSQPRLTQE
jgi:hypothetical protein